MVARLHESPRTASLPIVIMTAKSADVRAHFRGYPAVVDFVTKPFTPEDIIERVGKAARTSGGHAADAALPLARKEAAQVIYTRLRASLGKIPEWHKDLGDAPAAAYFAKKILTPVVVEDILAGLVPHVAQAVPTSPPQEMQLVGRFSALPFGALAQQLERAGHGGEVRVTVGERETVLYFRAGELVLASTCRPRRLQREDAGLDCAVPYEAFARAAVDQRGGGRPASRWPRAATARSARCGRSCIVRASASCRSSCAPATGASPGRRRRRCRPGSTRMRRWCRWPGSSWRACAATRRRRASPCTPTPCSSARPASARRSTPWSSAPTRRGSWRRSTGA
ncbi:MAG: hypothetical protein U1F43_01910 [Myxococcota bacterium]